MTFKIDINTRHMTKRQNRVAPCLLWLPLSPVIYATINAFLAQILDHLYFYVVLYNVYRYDDMVFHLENINVTV